MTAMVLQRERQASFYQCRERTDKAVKSRVKQKLARRHPLEEARAVGEAVMSLRVSARGRLANGSLSLFLLARVDEK